MKKFIFVLKRFFLILKEGILLDKSLFFIKVLNILLNNIMIYIGLILPKVLMEMIRRESLTSILYILIAYFCINLIIIFIDYKLTPISTIKNEEMNSKIIDMFLNKSINMELRYFDQPETYDKYLLVFDQCCAIVQNTINNFIYIFSSLIQIFFITSILSWMNKKMLFLLFFISIFQVILNNKTSKKIYEYQKKMVHHNRQINYLYRLFHIPEFMRDIRVNTLKDFIFKKKYKTVDKILDDTKINSVQVTKISTMRAIINLAEDLFIIAYFAYNVLAKIIWYDDFIVGINSYKQLKNSITQLLSVYTEIYKNDLYIKDYLNFMNNNINIVKSGDIALGVDDIECIEFKSVSFTYMNSKNSALRNINLTIKKNQKIAIVGENGAGKTTIIKLLLRLYDPDEGNIYINNIDIRDYSINSLRNAITVLFQDYSIYAFSIRDNIALNKNLSDYDINEYLEKVGLLDKINNLPFKLDTPITSQLMENGVEFSGGERQRLAIARSYARKSNILILDEPTSNLDPYIESKLYDDLLKDENEATMIIISHRMTFTYKMSRIICMSKGEIIAEGTHEDLINKNEYYRKLYNLNFSKYSS